MRVLHPFSFCEGTIAPWFIVVFASYAVGCTRDPYHRLFIFNIIFEPACKVNPVSLLDMRNRSYWY